mgnify:CR=1 FL=1
MNLIMFIIGSVILVSYIGGLLFMINKSHKDQERDLNNDPEIPNTFKDSY